MVPYHDELDPLGKVVIFDYPSGGWKQWNLICEEQGPKPFRGQLPSMNLASAKCQ